jgi:hypothetical protein
MCPTSSPPTSTRKSAVLGRDGGFSFVDLQQLIDAEGRSCIHVRITQDGKVVDSQGYMFDPEDE